MAFAMTLATNLKNIRDVSTVFISDAEIVTVNKLNAWVVSTVPIVSAIVAMIKPESDTKLAFCRRVFATLEASHKLAKLPKEVRERLTASTVHM